MIIDSAVAQYAREQVVSTRENYVTLYEITDPQGIAIWGGSDSGEAVYWLTRKSPAGSRVAVSLWDEDGEDTWLVGKPIDITSVFTACLGRDW